MMDKQVQLEPLGSAESFHGPCDDLCILCIVCGLAKLLKEFYYLMCMYFENYYYYCYYFLGPVVVNCY